MSGYQRGSRIVLMLIFLLAVLVTTAMLYQGFAEFMHEVS